MKFGAVVCSKCKQPIVSGQGFGYVCFKIPGKAGYHFFHRRFRTGDCWDDFLEGETGNGTTLRVCAGWRLDLLLKRRDMEKLKAKQTVSNLTEAEAIEQATGPAGRSASASTILGNCRLRDFLFRENSVTPVGDFTARAR